MFEPAFLELATLPALPLSYRAQLPSIPAVYFVIDANNTALYIGKALRLDQRWAAHHRYNQLVSLGTDIRIAWLALEPNNDLLFQVEDACITYFVPSLNRMTVPGVRRIELKLELDDPLLAFAQAEAKKLGMGSVPISSY